jgi:hypothetical protein
MNKIDYREYKVNLIRRGIQETDIPHVSSLDISIKKVPSSFSLRNNIPFIYDQGKFETCVSNATALYLAYLNNTFSPSRMFIYYNGRVMRGNNVLQDTGLNIVDGCLSVKTYPPCAEFLCEYNSTNIFTKPSTQAYSFPYTLTNYNYFSVSQDLQSIKHCIFEGFPIMVGIYLYSNFYNVSSNGIINMPSSDDKLEGGHCILVVGYDDKTQRFTCVNSWGSSWGNNGFFTLPYEYITDTIYTYDLYTMNITNKDINEHNLPTNKFSCSKCIIS